MANPRRIARLEREILRIVATAVLTDLSDPRVSTAITVTGVKLTRDLSFATVYYSVMGDTTSRATIERVLQHARGYLQDAVAKGLQIRSCPELSFEFDETIASAIELDETFRKLEQERRELAGETDEEEKGDDTNGDEAVTQAEAEAAAGMEGRSETNAPEAAPREEVERGEGTESR